MRNPILLFFSWWVDTHCSLRGKDVDELPWVEVMTGVLLGAYTAFVLFVVLPLWLLWQLGGVVI